MWLENLITVNSRSEDLTNFQIETFRALTHSLTFSVESTVTTANGLSTKENISIWHFWRFVGAGGGGGNTYGRPRQPTIKHVAIVASYQYPRIWLYSMNDSLFRFKKEQRRHWHMEMRKKYILLVSSCSSLSPHLLYFSAPPSLRILVSSSSPHLLSIS